MKYTVTLADSCMAAGSADSIDQSRRFKCREHFIALHTVEYYFCYFSLRKPVTRTRNSFKMSYVVLNMATCLQTWNKTGALVRYSAADNTLCLSDYPI